MGEYDLIIPFTSYARDNGQFECKMKEAGSGQILHSVVISVTILIIPGTPVITPRSPAVTEGENLLLNCSTLGGSPDPDIM